MLQCLREHVRILGAADTVTVSHHLRAGRSFRASALRPFRVLALRTCQGPNG